MTIAQTALRGDGFKTSWRDPFWEWLKQKRLPEPEHKTRLYICDPPVPRITPFDFAYGVVTADVHQINFELCICYCTVLEGLTGADEINDVYERYATQWAPRMDEYFSDTVAAFGLRCETAFDEFIEYAVWGNFATAEHKKVGEMMKSLNAP